MKDFIELSAKNTPLGEEYKTELHALFTDIDIKTIPLNICALEPKIINRYLYRFEIEVEYGGYIMTFWQITADNILYDRLTCKNPEKEKDILKAWNEYILWLTRESASEIIEWIKTISTDKL